MSGAVKYNKLLTKPSVSEVEEIAKLWLRYACDRSGGRNNRRSKAQAQPHVDQQQSDTGGW